MKGTSIFGGPKKVNTHMKHDELKEGLADLVPKSRARPMKCNTIRSIQISKVFNQTT